MLNFKFSNLCGVMYNSGNLSFANDENDFLYSPIGNKITVFDLKNGLSNTLPIESRSNVKLIEVSPDNNILVVVDVDGYAQLINLPRKIVIGHFNFRANVTALKVSPDGRLLAVACDKSLRIYEMPRLIKEFEPLVLYKNYTLWHYDAITTLSWSADSRFVLSGSKDTSVRLLNVFKLPGYIPFMFQGHKKKIIKAIFSEDNERIFSFSKDGVLFVWNYVAERSDDFNKQLEFNRRIKSNRNLSSRYKEAFGENSDDDEDNQDQDQVEKLVDLEAEFYSNFEKKVLSGRYVLEKKQQFRFDGRVSICEINSKANIIVFGLENGLFSLYDLNTLESRYTLQISDNKIDSLAINKSGSWLAFGSKKMGQLLVWEWKSESYVFKQQGHFFDVSCIAYSPDSSLLASGSQDGKIKIWDTSNVTCIVTFTEHLSKITGLAFVPNKNNVLVSSSLDGTVRAYDLTKYRNFRIMTTPQPCQLLCVAVDSSGEIVCGGSLDPYSIFVWSIKTGDLVEILTGHTGPVSCLKFSLIKDLLISGSWDKTAKSWELYSKNKLIETFEHTSDIVALDLSPDDKELAVATLNGEIYTWDVNVGSIKNILDCSRDIWGGRLQSDKMSAKNNSKNKNFNSIHYNLSGNYLIAGGNSQYICLYDMHYQTLVKKFCLTNNRSLDGINNKLNSKLMKSENEAHLNDYDKSDDSDYDNYDERNLLENLPGASKKVHSGKKFNLPIKILDVKFSHTNRAWAAATTEGIHIYSLDQSMNFGTLNLDVDVTPQNANSAFKAKQFVKAITYAVSLNNSNLITHFINNTPHDNIQHVSANLQFNIVCILLDFLALKLEKDEHVHKNLLWILCLLKNNGDQLKSLKNKNIFFNINKSIQRHYRGLTDMLEENTNIMKYVTESNFARLNGNDDEEMTAISEHF